MATGTMKTEIKNNKFLEKVKSTMKNKNYVIYTAPYILNIVGIRSKTRNANLFDDRMVVFYNDDKGNEIIKEYDKFTTDPGQEYLDKWDSKERGCAILKENQYIDTWIIDYHNRTKPDKKYYALVQSGYVNVYRDSNKDKFLDMKNNTLEKRNDTGINIHKVSKTATVESKNVKNASAGCQVFAKPWEFDEFLKLAYQQRDKGNKNKFTYTLLLEEEM